MCGIAGSYWKRPDPQMLLRMERALYVMRERGPNKQAYREHNWGYGSVLLGQTRLAVIDLLERASQPMYSSDDRYGIVFNGEIYNYIELRAELVQSGRVFVTESDTEVLLTAWEVWGKHVLKRLKGMFAFAIFDFEQNTCTLARDAFGIKPLFYSGKTEGFFFASDIRAMRALARDKVDLNWQRSYDYLVHGEYDFGQESFYKNFFSLQPGHLLELSLENRFTPIIQQWWKPSVIQSSAFSFDEASLYLREMLLDSVRLHMRSDVPIGAALSGGVDSSVIVSCMRYLEPDLPINTFSYIASDSSLSEERWVQEVNNRTNSIPHFIQGTPGDLLGDIEDLIYTQGEPFGSTSIYAQYQVFKIAKQNGMVVMLDGQGADEMLGGYIGYPGQRIHSMIDNYEFAKAVRFLNAWSQWPGRNRFEGFKRVVGEYSSGEWNKVLRSFNGMHNIPKWIRPGPLLESGVLTEYPIKKVHGITGRHMMTHLASSLTYRGLPALLRHEDRNSMRFSIESRVPFLTIDLADFVLSLPEDYLVSPNGETKRLLRSAMRGIVSDDILNRRDKIGFATPEKDWLLAIADQIRVCLNEDLGLPFLDQEALLNEFDQIVAGLHPFSWQVWRWLNFVQWYKQFI